MCATPSTTTRLAFFRAGCSAMSESLLPDRTPWSLAGAGIGSRSLAAQRQTATMANAPVAAEVHQPFDAHRHFAAQVAFDRHLADLAADRIEVRFRQILDPLARLDAGR